MAKQKLPAPWTGRSAADVWQEVWGHPCAHLPPPDFQALASVKADIVGVGNLYIRRLGGAGTNVLIGWMIAGVVLPAYRNRGLHSSLLAQREQFCRSTGVHFAGLDCEESLVPHYEKLGYRRQRNFPSTGVGMIHGLDETPFPSSTFLFREPW